jgi:hypothetical protein
MSLKSVRDQIVQALYGVPGVTPYRHRPDVLAEGAAWPLFGPSTRDAGTAFLQTWRVTVVLPADEIQASDWIDSHWALLFERLSPVGFVDTWTPAMLPTSAGELFTMMITMRAEE